MCIHKKRYKSSKGDSGGPFVCHGVLSGVVSSGPESNCGLANKPGVYTKISSYRKYLNRIVNRQSNKRSKTSRKCKILAISINFKRYLLHLKYLIFSRKQHLKFLQVYLETLDHSYFIITTLCFCCYQVLSFHNFCAQQESFE